jgi:endo-1,4-beta-xylanase
MTTNQNSNHNSIAKITSGILALILAACSLSPAENTVTTETQPSLVPNTPTYTATVSQTPTVEPTATIETSPTLVPTKSPEQVLAEFIESAEYKQGLDDYLNAMRLEKENVAITEELKVINGQEYRFLVATPHKKGLSNEQQNHLNLYESISLFLFKENNWEKIGFRDLSEILDVIFGNLILGRQMNSSTYFEIMKHDFGASLVDWHLQWVRTQPINNGEIQLNDASPLFSYINKLEKDTGKNYIKIGQHLIWENPYFLPTYIFDINGDKLLEEIIYHTKNLVLNAGDSVDVWTVVNEAETWHENKGKGYDQFFDRLGESYIVEAFKVAHRTDPDKVLLYSDFANETLSGDKYWQTKRVLELVQREQVPISIGLHMRIDVKNPPTKDQLKSAFKDYGVDIYMTELTLDLSRIPSSDTSRFLKQAEVARTITEAVIEYNNEAKMNGYPNTVKVIGFFGIGDSINFLEEDSEDADCTIFDDNFKPKPAYYGILETLYRLLDS